MSAWSAIGKALGRIGTKIGWKGGFMASTGLFAGSLLSGGPLTGGSQGSNTVLIVIVVAVAVVGAMLYFKSRPAAGRR